MIVFITLVIWLLGLCVTALFISAAWAFTGNLHWGFRLLACLFVFVYGLAFTASFVDPPKHSRQTSPRFGAFVTGFLLGKLWK